MPTRVSADLFVTYFEISEHLHGSFHHINSTEQILLPSYTASCYIKIYSVICSSNIAGLDYVINP